MIKRKLIYGTMLAAIISFAACSEDNGLVVPDEVTEEVTPPPAQFEALNLENYKNGSGVMMQAFYWDVEPRFEWWDTVSGKLEDWSGAGINRIWLPVATKGQSGGYSMGYDVSDYFDFGNFMQHGTVETRFGSREELESLIETAHSNDIEVIADIVLNHNSGGGEQYNPYRDKITYTLFNEENGNASGMFNRTYEDFHPNSVSESDQGNLFFAEQDLDHDRENVQDWLWEDENSVAKYYKNVMGFDGWRFDYVKGFAPWVINEWMDAVGGFAVGEYWDGDAAALVDWVEETGISAFDFAAFYKLEEALDRNDDLTYLGRDMLRKTHPEQAVTFVANHDTEKDVEDNRISEENKMKAYAYILTHDGYPTIFYLDYENEAFKEELQNLILIHNTIAAGAVEVLFNDNDEYIMKRAGNGTNPGLILYINTGESKKRREVNTNWSGKKLMDYANNSSYSPTVDASGTVSIEAPADSYSIWSVME